MSLLFRIEIDHNTVWRLIRKLVYQAGVFKLQIYFHDAGYWTIRKSGYKPIDALQADSPSELLMAVALILKDESDPESMDRQIEAQMKAIQTPSKLLS